MKYKNKITFFRNVTSFFFLFCIFGIAVTKVILHFKDNGMIILPSSKMVQKHFARCSELYEEEEEKVIVLNFVLFISVTFIAS
jgi:nucleoside diphosphate kinase